MHSRLEARHRFWLWLAYRMPRELAYWCAVRIWDHAIKKAAKDEYLFDMTVIDMMIRWERSHRCK